LLPMKGPRLSKILSNKTLLATTSIYSIYIQLILGYIYSNLPLPGHPTIVAALPNIPKLEDPLFKSSEAITTMNPSNNVAIEANTILEGQNNSASNNPPLNNNNKDSNDSENLASEEETKNSDEESEVLKYNEQPESLGYDLSNSDNSKRMSSEFYHNDLEESFYDLDIGKLDDDNHDKIEEILTHY
ncbi:15556_t:CDS:2, partial [Dentiscutata erythropus]